MFIADTHIHTYVSPDSKAQLDDILTGAVDAGVGVVVITDHCDLERVVDTDFFDRIDESFKITCEYQQRAASMGVELLTGIELGQGIYDPELTDRILASHPFDFVIASLHNNYEKSEFCWVDTTKLDTDKSKLLKGYFEDLLSTVEMGYGDTLAHLTYPLRYYIKANIPYDINDYMDKIKETMSLLIQKDMSLEVNAAGLRRLDKATQPDAELLKVYYNLGGRKLTIGSDAHYGKDVGSLLPKVHDMLKEIGFNSAVYYKQRKAVEYAL